ncbi:hypothetical protein L9F63_001749, partial [Diploptera punctata]
SALMRIRRSLKVAGSGCTVYPALFQCLIEMVPNTAMIMRRGTIHISRKTYPLTQFPKIYVVFIHFPGKACTSCKRSLAARTSSKDSQLIAARISELYIRFTAILFICFLRSVAYFNFKLLYWTSQLSPAILSLVVLVVLIITSRGETAY